MMSDRDAIGYKTHTVKVYTETASGFSLQIFPMGFLSHFCVCCETSCRGLL